MKNSKRLSKVSRGYKIAAASLLAGAILACSSDAQTVNPARVAEEVREPAYVMQALHEGLGIPHPRDMVATTLEEDLDYMTFVHDDDFNPHDALNLTFGVNVMHEYVKQLGMPEIDADVKAYIYSFPPEISNKGGESIALVAGEVRQPRAESIAFVANPCGYNSDASGLEIFLNKDNDSKLRIQAVAHELTHVYQNLLSQEGRCSDEPIPIWLNEGSADFLSVRAIMEGFEKYSDSIKRSNNQTYDQYRAHKASRVKDSDLPLELFEHILIPDSYDYGLLAVELLASTAGERSILGFYHRRSLHPDEPWKESFEETFDLRIDEFYKQFEEHQANGFPKLDIPKGETYVHEKSLNE